MRRVFVIFLILLFPLNVSALSISVSMLQQTGTSQLAGTSHPDAPALADDTAGGLDCEQTCDVDSDEPPSGMDFHDIVHGPGGLHATVYPAAPDYSRLPAGHGRYPLPPLKPPPTA